MRVICCILLTSLTKIGGKLDVEINLGSYQATMVGLRHENPDLYTLNPIGRTDITLGHMSVLFVSFC